MLWSYGVTRYTIEKLRKFPIKTVRILARFGHDSTGPSLTDISEEAKAVEKTLVIKGRAAVDALCPMASSVHVYEDEEDLYDAMLNQVGICK